MLENCRVNKGEKKNDEALARKMAALCDVYVNDAFGTAHRAEATTHGMARFAPDRLRRTADGGRARCAGQGRSHNPARPLVAIVAGAKVSTKLTILKSLAAKVDQLIVGGGIANTFMLAAGLPIGKSLAEPELVGEAQAVMEIMKARGAQVPLPMDVVAANDLSALARANRIAAAEVRPDDMILDIGPQTAAMLAALIAKAGTIVWNGPVGVFEYDQFAGGTESHRPGNRRARRRFPSPAAATRWPRSRNTESADRISYISTGGGAFLEFLEGKKLPAVEILEQRAAKTGLRIEDRGLRSSCNSATRLPSILNPTAHSACPAAPRSSPRSDPPPATRRRSRA